LGIALLAAVVLLGAWAAAAAWGGNGDGILDTRLVSRAGGAAGTGGNALSNDPSVSADGRYVAFVSSATNLDTSSDDAVDDIFVRDLLSNTTTLVSRATGASGAVGDGDSLHPSISADGRYVAFESDADNLDSDSNDSVGDIFLRDTIANTTTLVSRATGSAGAADNGGATDPSLSADGGHVSFQSFASNLSADDGDLINDVFVRDIQANTTTFVSRGSGPAGPGGNNNSLLSSVSADGRYVAFESFSSNLAASDNTVWDIFVRDTLNNTTRLVSRATGAGGTAGNGQSFRPSISADGRSIAFDSGATDLDPDSDDAVVDVFVRDTTANTTALVSRATGASGAVGDGESIFPSISADGAQIAFHSEADSLDPESDDALSDVFVRDLVGNATTLVSRATGVSGAVGDDDSFLPAISADASVVAFSSDADNLDSDSNDAVLDVFIRELVDPAIPQPSPVISPPTQPPFNLAKAIKRCKKKFPKGSKKRRHCVKRAKARA